MTHEHLASLEWKRKTSWTEGNKQLESAVCKTIERIVDHGSVNESWIRNNNTGMSPRDVIGEIMALTTLKLHETKHNGQALWTKEKTRAKVVKTARAKGAPLLRGHVTHGA